VLPIFTAIILHQSVTRFPPGTLSARMMMLNIRSTSDILEHGRLLLLLLEN
jgi:hypothetical protein